ncbi:MAG: glycosyl transferase, partial [Armatimonadota bacterium]|nr:glycosyl transferase [Armatimonadota bacterium]
MGAKLFNGISIDEFLFSPQCADIRPLLREYANCPGILVYGVFFGAAGYAARPPGPLVQNFTRCASSEVACSGKTIANPRMIYAIR